jgi:hypothetical protein
MTNAHFTACARNKLFPLYSTILQAAPEAEIRMLQPQHSNEALLYAVFSKQCLIAK